MRLLGAEGLGAKSTEAVCVYGSDYTTLAASRQSPVKLGHLDVQTSDLQLKKRHAITGMPKWFHPLPST
jgi:hypothetical protein